MARDQQRVQDGLIRRFWEYVDCCFIHGAQDVTLAVAGSVWDGQVCQNMEMS
jgi:hypothetical protein